MLSKLIIGTITLLSCGSFKDIPNIYEGFSEGVIPSREILILKEDNTFQYLFYSDEVCYISTDGLCGRWFMINDSIHFKAFDTVVQKILYFPDRSDTLTIELFDQFGCRFIWPVMASNGFFEGNPFTIENGYYKNIVGDQLNTMTLFDGFKWTVIQPAIKRDSMHMQIYGLSYPSSKFLEKTALIKKSNKLKGGYWGGWNKKFYIEKEFYPRRKLTFDGMLDLD